MAWWTRSTSGQRPDFFDRLIASLDDELPAQGPLREALEKARQKGGTAFAVHLRFCSLKHRLASNLADGRRIDRQPPQ